MNTHVFKLTFKMREHGHTVFFIAAYFRNFRIAKIALDINRIAHISFHIKATNILQKNNPIFFIDLFSLFLFDIYKTDYGFFIIFSTTTPL